jgi:electron transport complex protein RnfB
MSTALALIVPAAAALAAAFGARAGQPRPGGMADRIERLLPQTQCGKCGYDGCRPYAEAIARGEADIDRCPPGGDLTVRRLARLLGREEKTVDPALPRHVPDRVAHIDPSACIGCLKCVRACPVDAIIGARGRLHAVIPRFCTGCELCLPPCPVDCIRLVPRP